MPSARLLKETAPCHQLRDVLTDARHGKQVLRDRSRGAVFVLASTFTLGLVLVDVLFALRPVDVLVGTAENQEPSEDDLAADAESPRERGDLAIVPFGRRRVVKADLGFAE